MSNSDRTCPFCGKVIDSQSILCKHCKKLLPPEAKEKVVPATLTEDDLTLNVGGRKVSFAVNTGTVLGERSSSKTHVESYGGGAYVGQYGGYVEAPRIYTTTTTKQEIWIMYPDGREVCKDVYNSDVKVHAGHKVSFVYAKFENTKDYYLLGVHNHNISKSFSIMPVAYFLATGGFLTREQAMMGIKFPTWWWLGSSIFLTIAMHGIIGHEAVALLLSTVYVIGFVIWWQSWKTKKEKDIKAYSQDIYDRIFDLFPKA